MSANLRKHALSSLCQYGHKYVMQKSSYVDPYMRLYCRPPCLSFPGGSDGKESACNGGDPGLIPGLEDPLEKEMATYFSIVA